MSRRDIVNVSASIRSKLLNKSRKFQRPFLELLQFYSMERFLYRLSISDHSEKFFLKGGLMFRAWSVAHHRPTMDIDLLGKTTNSIQNLEKIFQEICQLNTPINDGIIFFPDTIKGTSIQSAADYVGTRIEFKGDLNKANINMQIDIGFGDVISPKPSLLCYPTILNLPFPKLQGYTPESVVAEKLEAMVRRGLLNSRMKDFFDIWTLAKQFPFNSKSLAQAIETTFYRRGTTMHTSPACFSQTFSSDPIKNAQWQSFIRKNSINFSHDTLNNIIDLIKQFLSPILEGISTKNLPDLNWRHPQNWTEE